MKTSLKGTRKVVKYLFSTGLVMLLFTIGSCSKTLDCEGNNTGTLIIENSRSKGIVKVFFNRVPRSGNVPGDLNIKPGEKANMDLSAGQIEVFALLDTSSCDPSGGTCIIRNETLDPRTVNLESCQDLNLTY